MSNIVKSHEPQFPTELDPFQVMREMLRWDPFRTLTPSFGAIERAWTPSFEVRENSDAFLFKADLPGIKAEEIDISLTGNRLQIAGKREAEKETKEDKVYLYERSYGEFRRTFTLPDAIDGEHIRSEMKEGVLTIVVPKKAVAKPKKITVTGELPKS
jgi:HSP20 family protein